MDTIAAEKDDMILLKFRKFLFSDKTFMSVCEEVQKTHGAVTGLDCEIRQVMEDSVHAALDQILATTTIPPAIYTGTSGNATKVAGSGANIGAVTAGGNPYFHAARETIKNDTDVLRRRYTNAGLENYRNSPLYVEHRQKLRGIVDRFMSEYK